MRLPERIGDRHGCGLVFTVACLAYATALFGIFVYDDLHSVRDNPALRSLANVPWFFTDVTLFSSLENHMYRPVLLVTFALNHAVSGLDAWAYKLTDILLHALSAGMLVSIARKMGAALAPATIGALLFAAHPLASEAVNMVSARSDMLVTLGLLFGIRCHLAAMEGSRWATLGTAAAAILACGSKVTGVVLPTCLVLLEALRYRSSAWSWRAALVRVAPSAAVSGIYLVIRRALLGAATVSLPPMTGGSDILVGGGRDLVTHWATMCLALPQTLAQVIVPFGLSLDPKVHYARDLVDPHVVCGALFLVAVTWLGVRAPRRRPLCLLGTALAWVTCLPWIVIPLNIPLSEHRLYGLLAGLALVAAGGLPATGWGMTRRTAAVAATVAVFAILSGARSLDYRHERYLWEKVLRHNPDSVRGICGMAIVHLEDGNLSGARTLLRRAVGVHDAHISARRNLAETNLMLGSDGEPFTALVMADYLVEKNPSNPFHRLLLSRALITVGDWTGEAGYYAEAEVAALSCLEIAEPKGLVYRTAAYARRKVGDLEGAIGLLNESVDRGLDHASVLIDRSRLLAEAGRVAEAEEDFRRAWAADPLDPSVQEELYRRGALPIR